MASVLFVHNGSPGRFEFLANALTRRGWRCALVNGPDGRDLPGAQTVRWSTERGSTAGILDLAVRAEADMLRGYAAAEAAAALRAQGFRPDLIIGHPGWGEMLFLGEVFPDARQIQIGEFYYRSNGADVNFDPEFQVSTLLGLARVHAKNAGLALSYANAHSIVVPTPFQASLLPAAFRARTVIIHEGVDTDRTRQQENRSVVLASGVRIERGAPVVTFINRYFEPLRGFRTFMRALPTFLAANPDAHVLMIGSDSSKGYGPKPTDGRTWRDVMLEELAGRMDLARVHFTGPLPYEKVLLALSVSTAHVYLTYPFVLSWSLLDAMACECLIVASDTAPVRDVVRDGENGLLTDFFDHEALAARLTDICRDPVRYEPLRRAARDTIVTGYDRRSICEPAWMSVIDSATATQSA